MSSSKTKPIQIVRNIFLKSKLRSLSLKWPPRNDSFKLSRVDRGQYKCGLCQSIVHYSQLNIDHIQPVIPITGIELQDSGEIDWNKHIPRLFCGIDNLQAICTKCHDSKSLTENIHRVAHRDSQREKNKLKLKVDKKRKKL